MPELPSKQEHYLILKEVLKHSETLEFENAKRYIVFVDVSQVDFETIISMCEEPAKEGEEFDIQFIPVRKLPNSSDEAVKLYEVKEYA